MLTDWSTARMGERFPRAMGRWKIRRCVKKKSFIIRKNCASRSTAGEKVKEGQVLILDSGTTTTAIARALRNFSESHDHHERREYCRRTRRNCRRSNPDGRHAAQEFLFAGRSDRRRNTTPPQRGFLFLGVDGFDVHFGLSTPNLLEAKVNRVMVEVAKKTVAVCDSSKFGRRSLSLIAPPSALQEVITDRGVPKSDLRALKQAGIE